MAAVVGEWELNAVFHGVFFLKKKKKPVPSLSFRVVASNRDDGCFRRSSPRDGMGGDGESWRSTSSMGRCCHRAIELHAVGAARCRTDGDNAR